MVNKSLLDIESDQPDDRSSSTERKSAAMDDLFTSVAIIKSNYVTKEELAVVSGKLDTLISIQHTYATKEELAVISGKLDALISIQHTYATKEELAVISGKLDAIQHNYATKAELADAVYQLTWRMAGFALASISATVAFIRYL
jgi:hypothetical protein